MLCWQIIMDRLYKAVREKVGEGSKFQQALFNYAYEYKCKKFEAGFSTPLVDAWANVLFRDKFYADLWKVMISHMIDQ